MILTIASAERIVGGLSKPSKMPCYGISLPAEACPIGSKLVSVKGSVCEGCYALKGAYSWKGVKSALQRRLDIVQACEFDPAKAEEWIDAMAYLLNERRSAWKPGKSLDSRYFRWHDSGDIQGYYHLAMIAEVTYRTPRVKHWLPTRELPVVREYMRFEPFPKNLNVRISANRVDASLPMVDGCTASGVHSTRGATAEGVTECPAIHNDNACGDCRKCWDPSEKAISYLKH